MSLMFARRRQEEEKKRAEAKAGTQVTIEPPKAVTEDIVTEPKVSEPLMLERPERAAKLEAAKDRQRRKEAAERE